MKLLLNNVSRSIAVLLIVASSGSLHAVKFDPGAGAGLEYTNNAKLNDSNKVSDVVAATYVGAKLTENEGALRYDFLTSLNKHNYTQGSYENQRYFNLAASADWAMVKDRFNWNLSDRFTQRPVISLNSNTPNNVQDTNAFNFGANIRQPVSRRQNFTIIPLFSQYYYETLVTDNRQYSLAVNWSYQLQRLLNLGLNLSSRSIDYTQQSLPTTKFTSFSLVMSGNRKRFRYSLNIGSTNVKRDNGQETSGFSGNADWSVDLSSRSQFKAFISTELTDSSSVAFSSSDPLNGNDVQVSTDVIRSTVANASYTRKDAAFDSLLWLRYNKLKYSENPLDREIRSFGLRTTHPLTRKVNGSYYLTYRSTKQLQTLRVDKDTTLGGNLKYKMSRKWHSLFDLKYRQKQSTTAAQNYNEFTAFASLVYGFGSVYRPTRAGGY